MNKGRRRFIQGAAMVGAGIATARDAAAWAQQDMNDMPGMKTKGKKDAAQGYPPVAVASLDVPDLPFRMDGNVKEFHLIAEPVKHEIIPGRILDLWGYNGSAPGPTIQVNQG